MPVSGCRQFVQSMEGPSMFIVWTIFLNLLSNDISSALQKEIKVQMRLIPYVVLGTTAILYWFVRRRIKRHHQEAIDQRFRYFGGTLALNLLSNDISSAVQNNVEVKCVPYVVLITVAVLYKMEIYLPQEYLHQQLSPQSVINIDNEDVTDLQRGLLHHNPRALSNVQMIPFLQRFVMGWDLLAGSTLINRSVRMRNFWHMFLSARSTLINGPSGVRDFWHIHLSAGSNVISRASGMRNLWQINVSGGTSVINRALEMTMITPALEMGELRHDNLSARSNGSRVIDLAPKIISPNATESKDKGSRVETTLEPSAPEKPMKDSIPIKSGVDPNDLYGSLDPPVSLMEDKESPIETTLEPLGPEKAMEDPIPTNSGLDPNDKFASPDPPVVLFEHKRHPMKNGISADGLRLRSQVENGQGWVKNKPWESRRKLWEGRILDDMVDVNRPQWLTEDIGATYPRTYEIADLGESPVHEYEYLG